MKYETQVENKDGVVYKASSDNLEDHVNKLHGIERIITHLERMPVCDECGGRFDPDLGEGSFCTKECMEDHIMNNGPLLEMDEKQREIEYANPSLTNQ